MFGKLFGRKKGPGPEAEKPVPQAQVPEYIKFIDAIAKAAKQIVNGRENGDEVGSFFDVAEQLMEGRFPVQG